MAADRSSRASKRINGKKRFLITGFVQEDKERLASMILKLGGEYIDDRAFKEKCTHLICEVPNRSEKFLGACATGRWILKSSYLEACTKVGTWVDEQAYEWTDQNIGNVKHPFLYRAPRRWREYVRQTEQPAFDGWRVVLVIDDPNMKLVFRRLLEVGGADAVICKLPPSVDRCVTHIFVKTKISYDYLTPWREQGVPCLAPDYIGDFLVEDNLPPLCSRDVFLLRQQHEQQQKRHPQQQQQKPSPSQKQQTPNVPKSTPRVELCPMSQDSTFICDSKPGSRSSSTSGTPMKNSPKSAPRKDQKLLLNPFQNLTNKIEKPSTRPRTRSSASSTPQTPDETDGTQIQIPTTEALKKLFVKIDRRDSCRSSDSDSSDDKKVKRRRRDDNNNNNRKSVGEASTVRRSTRTVITRPDYARMHFGKITPTEEEKKQNFVSRETSSVAMEESFTAEEGAIHSLYGSSPRTALKRQNSRDSNPKPAKRLRYEDALTSLDQQQRHHSPIVTSSALPVSMNVEEIFNACYEEGYFAEALYEVQNYMNSKSHPTSEMVWKLMAILFSSTDQTLSDAVYNTLKKFLSLHPPSNPALTLCYLNSMRFANSAWEFLTATIDACKGENIDEIMDTEQQIHNAMLLLDFLTCVFSVNLMYCESSQEKMIPLFTNVIWTSTEYGDLNFKVRHLMSLVADATTSDEDSKLRKLLYSLVISGFRSLQSVCKETQLNAGKSDIFIAEMVKRLHPEHCEQKILARIVENLRDTTLGIGVMSFALDTMDSIVFMDKCNDVSLGKILGHYLFCIPKNGPRPEMQMTPKSKSKKNIAPLSKVVVANINKRNIKGETKLHRACIKGDATMVRQLLNVSGIDVNIQDFAGWTALHEACNAGHLQCVQLLLDYKPPKTIECYFSPKPVKQSRKVDLLLSDPTFGTTVLHDAVMNERLDVVKILVKHGGRRLREQTNAEGKTPMDLAESEEMLEALTGSEDNELSSSQMDWSQLSTQSEDMNEMYARTDNMSCTTVAECERFLFLFESLFMSYIKVNTDTKQQDEGYVDKFPRYVRKLKRHIQRIVVEESKDLGDFAKIFERFDLLAESFV